MTRNPMSRIYSSGQVNRAFAALLPGGRNYVRTHYRRLRLLGISSHDARVTVYCLVVLGVDRPRFAFDRGVSA